MQNRFQDARTTAYQAVHLLDQRLGCDALLIGAKNTGHELAMASGKAAMELHGAHALDGDYPLQRLWRDIQHTYPPAGTGEFQRVHLAKTALGTDSIQWSEHFAAETAWSQPTPDPTAA